MIFVKFISFIVNRDSMNESPVSEAPTTTILVLLETLVELSCFLVRTAREKGVSA